MSSPEGRAAAREVLPGRGALRELGAALLGLAGGAMLAAFVVSYFVTTEGSTIVFVGVFLGGVLVATVGAVVRHVAYLFYSDEYVDDIRPDSRE